MTALLQNFSTLNFQSRISHRVQAELPSLGSFVDSSHTLYYASTRRRSNAVRCQAAASSSNSGGANKKPARRERVKRRAAELAESLDRLEMDESLASYDLKLPSSSMSTYEFASSSSSSSSSESEAENSTASSSSRLARLATAYAPATTVASISVCQGKACRKRGSDRVLSALQQTTAGMSGVEVVGCGKCMGQCKRGPAVKVEMPTGEQIVYVGVNGADSAVQLASVVLQ